MNENKDLAKTTTVYICGGRNCTSKPVCIYLRNYVFFFPSSFDYLFLLNNSKQ